MNKDSGGTRSSGIQGEGIGSRFDVGSVADAEALIIGGVVGVGGYGVGVALLS